MKPAPITPSGSKTAAAAGRELAHWHQALEVALAVLGRLADLAAERGETDSAASLSEARSRLAEGRLNLAVLGEFKRGKSTLINALLDSPVMPVGVIPTTSVPLQVEYGASTFVEVELETGQRLTVGPDQLPEFATEAGNPHNRKRVARVLVRHPAAILANGVVLVDTPGIGSLHTHNTEAAYAYLREADAAVFVLSVDSPASRAELEFLGAARERVGRILFVLNKADLLSPAELEQASEFVLRVLAQAGGGAEVNLFPLSARERDPGFARFLERLERFLVGERAAFLILRATALAGSALRDERRSVALERAALQLSDEEATCRSAKLAARLAEIRRQRLEVEELLHGDTRRLVAEVVDPSVEEFRQEAQRSLEAAVRGAAGERGGTPAQWLEELVPSEMRRLVIQWLDTLQGAVEAALSEVGERHAGRTNRLLGDAVREIGETFQVDLAEASLLSHIDPAGARVVLLEEQLVGLEVVASGLKRLAPGRIGRQLAVRDSLRRVAELVDRHCGRVHHDVTSRVTRKEMEWRRELQSLLAGLEASVARAGSLAAEARARGDGAVAAAMAALDRRETELIELGARLDAGGYGEVPGDP